MLPSVSQDRLSKGVCRILITGEKEGALKEKLEENI